MHEKIQVNIRPNTLNTVIWVFLADPVLSGLVKLESSAIKPVTTVFTAYSDLKTKWESSHNLLDTLKTHNPSNSG